jgi:hypothetical protein
MFHRIELMVKKSDGLPTKIVLWRESAKTTIIFDEALVNHPDIAQSDFKPSWMPPENSNWTIQRRTVENPAR